MLWLPFRQLFDGLSFVGEVELRLLVNWQVRHAWWRQLFSEWRPVQQWRAFRHPFLHHFHIMTPFTLLRFPALFLLLTLLLFAFFFLRRLRFVEYA
jgi:hypothetical protein